MHEPLRAAPVGQPRVQALDEAFAQRLVLGRDALAVALEESRQELRDERLVDRARAVQPIAARERRSPSTGACRRASARIARRACATSQPAI